MSSPPVRLPPTLLLLAVVLFVLCLLPVSVAQPPPPPPPPFRFHSVDAVFHGWDITDLAADPNRDLLYIIDSACSVVAINTTHSELSWLVLWDSPYAVGLDSLTVDSRSILYVLGRSSGLGFLQVISPEGRSLHVVQLASLTPPLQTPAQLVTDSSGFLYLTTAFYNVYSPLRVWVLDGDSYEQVDSWIAPVPIPARLSGNYTPYVLGIDGSDTLYFQQGRWERRSVLVSTQGQLVGSLSIRADITVTDLAIDSRGNLYLAGRGGSSVLVFDSKGYALPALSVLNTGDDSYGPSLDFDYRGRLYVADTYSNEVLAVTGSGDITRAYYSRQATVSGQGELLVDGNNGDLLVSDYFGSVIAQRISSRDGSLISQYKMPGRLSEDCYSQALDLGTRWSRIYTLITCFFPQDRMISYRLHVIHPNGKVLAEYRLPQGGRRLRVDEWNGRLYIADHDYRKGQGSLRVYDLQGRALLNLTAEPPFGHISDIVLFPDLSGLAVLDWQHDRVVGLYANNTLAWVWLSNSSLDAVTDLAYSADGSSLYYSQVQFFWLNNSFQYYNSSVVRLAFDGQWQVTDEYSSGPPPVVGGPAFNAIAINQRGDLFALDYAAESLFVWRSASEGHQQPRRLGQSSRQHRLQAPSSSRLQPASSPLQSKRGRHQGLSGW